MTQQIVINNQLLSYIKEGNEAVKTTLLFLHGWRSSKEAWLNAISKLIIMNNQLSIIALDLPGFGQSPAPKEPWGVGEYANLVGEFISKLNLNNVIIVGHSFGGRVGIKLASLRPDLIKKLVLVDAAGFAMDADIKSVIGVVAKIVRPFFKPKFMQGLRKKIYQQIGAEDYVATPELQKIFVKIVNEDLTEHMKRILQPTLLVWGENDKYTPVEYLHNMRTLIPNTKYHILQNAGHFSFLDKPEEFVRVLTEFV